MVTEARRAYDHAYYLAHKGQQHERRAQWKRDHPERERVRRNERARQMRAARSPVDRRRLNTREKYKVDIDALIEQQGGLCLLCRESLAARRHVVDHDHACCTSRRTCGQCVRGVICQSCNIMEGQVAKAIALGLVSADGPLVDYMARRVALP